MSDRWSRYLVDLYAKSKLRPAFYDLERITRLHKYLGYPSDAYHKIHVTGTNGKGSFTYKTAKALEAAGYRVGMFTSPHLTSFRERIQVNSQPVDKEFLISFKEQLEAQGEVIGESLTMFDLQVLQAFQYFKEQHVDVAVVEVGMGGLRDSTNVLRNPLSCVITNIALDHTEMLGPTKTDILRNKLGILKAGSLLVLGDQVDTAMCLEASRRLGCEMLQVQRPSHLPAAEWGLMECVDEMVKLNFSALKKHFKIDSNILKSVPSWSLPGRLQKVHSPNEKLVSEVYLDVGHNEDAIRGVLQTLDRGSSKSPLKILYGGKAVKDIQRIIMAFLDHADIIEEVVFVSMSQGHSIQQIEDILSKVDHPDKGRLKYSNEGIDLNTCLHSLFNGNETRSSTCRLLVIGSFHLIPTAYEFFKIPAEIDGVDMNDTYRFK